MLRRRVVLERPLRLSPLRCCISCSLVGERQGSGNEDIIARGAGVRAAPISVVDGNRVCEDHDRRRHASV
ncbi:hypothetical protein QKD39_gp47 [Psittacine adenovirus 1]|uniref:Uncharacterized protein n=1 Tax=Psittacine adenovirus 1 TaxID=318592 RepID=A0A2Z5E1C8_9ADEN|nr:hypothetical protein QKD39_gp47 [Psittacine adenovirus 1]AXB73040.1 hypothetical protein [Psittacine adenovirus 1]